MYLKFSYIKDMTKLSTIRKAMNKASRRLNFKFKFTLKMNLIIILKIKVKIYMYTLLNK